MAEQFIYHMQDLKKVYPGGKEVLKGIFLSFYPGAKIGVIGGNGAGKSTVMKIMAGLDTDFVGEAWLAKGKTVGYLPQEPVLDETLDVMGNVKLGVAATQKLLDDYEAVNMAMGEPDADFDVLLDKQAKLQDAIDAANAWELESQLDQALDALRCPPGDSSVEHLSGGEKRRIALCRLLLEKPDLLLLDEPTNHLDAESVAWLEGHLQSYAGTIVLITHDRYFLDNVTEWILELEGGKGLPWKGNYSSWLEQKTDRLRAQEKQESSRQRALSDELDWIRQSQRARQTKSKARIKAYDELVNQANDASAQRKLELRIPIPEKRLGDLVIETEGLKKGFGDKLLIEDLNVKIPPGAIVGIVGANGAGKSTFFRMVMGEQQPDAGTLRVGPTVDVAYVDQGRANLVGDKTIWEEISGGAEVIEMGSHQMRSRAYVGAFGFKGSDQQKPVGQLSGGERNRVHLAKLLKSGGNVLLLDEPTNDLDVNTLRALEDALINFPGCVLIVSHDRYFLDRIATHILAFEGNSHVEWFEGNFADYIKDKKSRLGPDADIPKRIKYRKFSR
ncbi:MAG: sulfate-transporting ATPase [Bradymonadia bacterium]|jgi:sulfate-transporting ATPase